MRKVLCILGLLLLLPVWRCFASEPRAELFGPDAICAQDYFSLPIKVDAAEITSFAFTLTYDTEDLIFLGFGYDEALWQCKPDRDRFTFTTDTAVSGEDMPELRFQLREVPVGTPFWVTFESVTICIDDVERQLSALRWEQTASRMISSENHLSGLKISDAALSPEFSPYQQSYTAKVSYHIAAIEVMATAMDPYAQIQISNPELKPNAETNVTVTVMAEDGSERVYTIAVTREDDPNRPLSSACELSDITVEGFMLSPEFKPGVSEYVLWLPYEVSSVEISATAKDQRATVTVEGNTRLKAGQDNPIRITCRAEDGTAKVYTIIAKRAEEYVPVTSEASTATLGTAATDAFTVPNIQDNQQGSDVDVQIPSWAYVVIGVAAVTGAAAIGILVSERKK